MLAIFRRKKKAATDFASLPDEELMVEYRQGTIRAFEVLLERHRRPVFNFLYRFVGNPSAAEDLLQEVFLRVVRNADSYRANSKFTTWLYTIARNLAIDQTRRRKHQRAVSLDRPLREGDERTTHLDMLADARPGSDQDLADRQFASSLYRALEGLPEEQREVFLLREYHGLPFKEISDVVGVPVNTVKSRMRYALEGLRRQLVEHRGDAALEFAEQVAP